MTAGIDGWVFGWLAIARAIRNAGNNMPPWFYRKETPQKWAERLNRAACAGQRDAVIREMIAAKTDGHHNRAADLLNLLVVIDGRTK